MTAPNPDQIDRTVLIAVHDGTAATIEAAEAAHARTGVVLLADGEACTSVSGQAALLTAVTTAVRAFGSVHVTLADPQAVVATGFSAGSPLCLAAEAEGARLVGHDGAASAPSSWPTLLIGAVEAPARSPACAPTLRAQWTGWIASVEPARSESQPVPHVAEGTCVLAAIAAAALAVSEAFNIVLSRAGSDAGYRAVTLNLWDPGTTSNGPTLRYAPAAWWLVGLGHLGQAYSWVLSWLNYAQPAQVHVVLQDTDRATPANRSTGMLTPPQPDHMRKTRLVASALDRVGYDTFIVERRMDSYLRVPPDDVHVALLGVDNLNARRVISSIGWRFAIDAGLGSGPSDFSSILIRRFPSQQTSAEIAGWAEATPPSAVVPASPAFDDLRGRTDACGLNELAGKAVGAAFVGAVAATLVIAEATRELHGGTGADVTALNLDTLDQTRAPASKFGDVVPAAVRITHEHGAL
jgi:hypothetical protein